MLKTLKLSHCYVKRCQSSKGHLVDWQKDQVKGLLGLDELIIVIGSFLLAKGLLMIH